MKVKINPEATTKGTNLCGAKYRQYIENPNEPFEVIETHSIAGHSAIYMNLKDSTWFCKEELIFIDE